MTKLQAKSRMVVILVGCNKESKVRSRVKELWKGALVWILGESKVEEAKKERVTCRSKDRNNVSRLQ